MNSTELKQPSCQLEWEEPGEIWPAPWTSLLLPIGPEAGVLRCKPSHQEDRVQARMVGAVQLVTIDHRHDFLAQNSPRDHQNRYRLRSSEYGAMLTLGNSRLAATLLAYCCGTRQESVGDERFGTVCAHYSWVSGYRRRRAHLIVGLMRTRGRQLKVVEE